MKTILLSLAALVIAVPATAQTRDVPVRHADLDLRTRDGIAALDRRIAHAIDAACPPDDSRELARQAVVQRCHALMRTTVRQSRDQVVARAGDAAQMAASNR